MARTRKNRKKGKPRGAPFKSISTRKAGIINLRVHAQLRDALQKRCEESGHSLSVEVSNRLQASLKAQGAREAETGPIQYCVGCGCTETCRCPGGCTWAVKGVCSRCFGISGLVLQQVRRVSLDLQVP